MTIADAKLRDANLSKLSIGFVTKPSQIMVLETRVFELGEVSLLFSIPSTALYETERDG